MTRKNRWYDAHQKLADALETLKGTGSSRRSRIVNRIIALMNEESPGLLEKYLLHFPLDQERRRWYDKDPFLWLMVNGLRYANHDLLQKATHQMDLAVKPGGGRGSPALKRSAK
jgi:hypothetical protein